MRKAFPHSDKPARPSSSLDSILAIHEKSTDPGNLPQSPALRVPETRHPMGRRRQGYMDRILM